MKFNLTRLYSSVFSARTWQETVTIFVILSELAWMSAWYGTLLLPNQVWGTVFFTLGLVIFSAYYLSRWMEHRGVRSSRRWLIFLAFILVCLLISLKFLVYPGEDFPVREFYNRMARIFTDRTENLGIVVHTSIILLIILRGLVLAREPIGVFQAFKSFQIGLIAFLIYGIVSLGDNSHEITQSYAALYLFLFFGLIGLITARISNLSHRKGGKVPVFRVSWFVSTLLAALVVVTLGAIVGWVLGGKIGQWIAQVYVLLAIVLTFIFLILLSPILYILSLWATRILNILISLLNQLADLLKPFFGIAGQPVPSMNLINPYTNTVFLISRNFILGAVLVFLISAILLTLMRKRLNREIQYEEGTLILPRMVVMGLFQLILNRDRKSIGIKNIWAVTRIRQIYIRFTSLCEKRGYPRQSAVTPLEFQAIVRPLFPGRENDISILTQAYLQVRYGEIPETFHEVQMVMEAWERIKNFAKYG